MKDLERKFEFDNNMKILDNYSIDQETPFKSIIKLSQNYLCDLHKSIHSKSFESITSEINFFKEIKQQPLQALIYSSELQIFEARFPKGNKIKQQKYILENMKDVNRYFQNNLEFCEYIKMGLVHFDEFYFTRKYFFEFSSFCSAPFFRDPEFSTSHDFLLAKYFTNYKLLSYMEKRLHKLNDVSLNKIKNSGLKWTSSKVALTELTYALYHGGCQQWQFRYY